MSDELPQLSRKSVSLPAELWEKVSAYRFGNRIGSEAEAIRRLIEAGLRAEERQ